MRVCGERLAEGFSGAMESAAMLLLSLGVHTGEALCWWLLVMLVHPVSYKADLFEGIAEG